MGRTVAITLPDSRTAGQARGAATTIKDPLYPALRRFWKGLQAFPIDPAKTALLVVDMQYMTCARDYGLGRRMADRGLVQLAEAYFAGIDRIVPRIAALIAACRAAGINIAHATIAAATEDGRDMSPLARHHGLIATRGSKERKVLPALAPGPKDLILTRSTLSVLTPHSADQFLRNMGVETLLIAGVMTDVSIQSTARDAGDRGYFTIVVGDACWALDAEDHRRALEPLDMWYGHVVAMDELIVAIREGTAVA